MSNYLVKILITILFSSVIAFFYYFINPEHIENFDGYFYFALPLILIYSLYKYFKTNKSKYINFSFLELIGYFLIVLFLLSLYFFGNFGGTDYTWSTGFILFFKILGFLILPILLIFISISFGSKLIKSLNIYSFDKDYTIFNFLLSLSIGFFSFVFCLTVLGLLGFYNIYSVIGIVMFFSLISKYEIIDYLKGFLNFKITFENNNLEDESLIKNIGLKLLSSEFLFILSSIIFSVTLISIIRPMPIGWDDLGVYMNFPRQMAYSGTIDFLAGMYSWQVFTGIGFMISEPTQAFFLNSMGGFLSFIVLILIFSDLLGNINKDNKTIINIPLLLAFLFISLPMVVFQQAKDMKLDEGLFFISIIVFYLVVKIFKKSDNKIDLIKKFFGEVFKKNKEIKKENYLNNINYFLESNIFLTDKKLNFKLLLIIGILAGFAFSLKFTSLLLISAIIGVLFYTEIGFFGFLGYIFVYFALFTKSNLWSYLNVSYPKENTDLLNIFSLISFVFGLILLVIGFLRYKGKIINLLKNILIFILGIVIALLPWLGKNVYQSFKSNTEVTLGLILNGKSDRLVIDYNKIYNKNEIESINTKIKEERKNNLKDSKCAAGNEDLCRYFGYEEGINNFVKLPWNLTMQLNQGKEFTDIGWLFLAFIPVLFLFLKFRKPGFEYFIVFFLLIELLLFVFTPTSNYLTLLMGNIKLPFGYLVILLLFFIPTLYLLFGLKNNKLNNLFKVNLIFTFFYVFLFVISAFGIVWYGITMYFSFLLMIGIPLYSISSYKDSDDEKIKDIKLFGTFIIFITISMYFFLNVIPHSFNNLKGAGYTYFKAGDLTFEESIFAYHPEYKSMISNLNLDLNKSEKIISSAFELENINDKFIYNVVLENKLDFLGVLTFLDKIYKGDLDSQFKGIFGNNTSGNNRIISIRKSAKEIQLKLFKIMLKPKEEFQDKSSIYRIGTFIKYYINGNNNRLYEDNLISGFYNYFYNKDSVEKTVYNLKGVGIKYLLVDLNAATIDNDPRHNLTFRYEKLLEIFTDKNLSLIESDSLCLKAGIEGYNKSEKSNEDLLKYIKLSGVNHYSYSGLKVISRNDKLRYCHSIIGGLLKNDEINKNNYNYLLKIRDEYLKLVESKQIIDTKSLNKYLEIRVKTGAKVLFEIK